MIDYWKFSLCLHVPPVSPCYMGEVRGRIARSVIQGMIPSVGTGASVKKSSKLVKSNIVWSFLFRVVFLFFLLSNKLDCRDGSLLQEAWLNLKTLVLIRNCQISNANGSVLNPRNYFSLHAHEFYKGITYKFQLDIHKK